MGAVASESKVGLSICCFFFFFFFLFLLARSLILHVDETCTAFFSYDHKTYYHL